MEHIRICDFFQKDKKRLKPPLSIKCKLDISCFYKTKKSLATKAFAFSGAFHVPDKFMSSQAVMRVVVRLAERGCC